MALLIDPGIKGCLNEEGKKKYNKNCWKGGIALWLRSQLASNKFIQSDPFDLQTL